MSFLLDIYEKMIQTIMATGATDTAIKFLTISSSDFTIAETVYEYVLPIGLVLVVLYFLIDLMEKSTSEHFTAEQFAKMLIKLVIAELLVQNGSKIIVVFCNISNSLINQINAIAVSSSTLADQMGVADMNSFNSSIVILCNIVMAILPWALSIIINILIIVICFSRKLELVVRCTMAPIGMSDLIAGGMNSRGMRYLKKIIAVLFQGVFIVVICKASASLLAGNSALGSAFAFLPYSWTGLIQGFIVLSLMKGAKDFANDMLA